jgi:hypothetical protein
MCSSNRDMSADKVRTACSSLKSRQNVCLLSEYALLWLLLLLSLHAYTPTALDATSAAACCCVLQPLVPPTAISIFQAW